MGDSLKVAKVILKSAGVNKAQIRKLVKPVSKEISSIAKGLPKKEKKELYDAFISISNNPANEQASNVIKSKIKKLSDVQEAATKKGYFSQVEEHHAISDIYDRVTAPIRMGEINKAFQKFGNDLGNSIREVMPKASGISFSSEEISKMIGDSLKSGRRQANKDILRILAYPFTKGVSLFAPKNIKALCGDTIKLERSKFGQEFYQKLVKQQNLEALAPKQIIIKKEASVKSVPSLLMGENAASCSGGYNPMSNTIEFTSEFKTLPKKDQASLIAHELTHFKQADAIVRTFGVEKYIEALKESKVNSLLMKKKFKGQPKHKIREIVDDAWKKHNAEAQVKESFKDAINGSKIDPKSELGQKAQQYLDAQKNYVAPYTEKGIEYEPKGYRSNLLEQEAYAVGGQMKRWVSVFENMQIPRL